MANELQIGALCVQVEYSTEAPGAGAEAGPNLATDFSFALSGGPTFSTAVTRKRDGSELRHIKWAEPLHRYSLDLSAWPDESINDMRDMFTTARGAYQSFRARSFIDDNLTYEPIGYGDGSASEFQIVKTYYEGGRSIEVDITRIIAGTVSVYVAANVAGGEDSVSENTEYGIDYETGIITFVTAPEADSCIRVSCSFERRVRFSSDSVSAVMHTDGTSGIDSLEIFEVRD